MNQMYCLLHSFPFKTLKNPVLVTGKLPPLVKNPAYVPCRFMDQDTFFYVIDEDSIDFSDDIDTSGWLALSGKEARFFNNCFKKLKKPKDWGSVPSLFGKWVNI